MALAERTLSHAYQDNEPEWMRFMDFGQASLASQAGQALRDVGDHSAAEAQFAMSIALRDTSAHRRIHGLTLANLADAQARQGKLDQGCHNWNSALDYLSGMHSGRARASISNIRQRLHSFGPSLPAAGKVVVIRATEELRRQASWPMT